jgi:hypothetical protein
MFHVFKFCLKIRTFLQLNLFHLTDNNEVKKLQK